MVIFPEGTRRKPDSPGEFQVGGAMIAAKSGYVSRRNAAWEKKHGYAADDARPVELYRLDRDPGQRVNVAADEPELVRRLQAELATIRR